ncbi:DUF3592 domain-containing protein [Mucilaginibacter lutimaris]|uniref:DUF3592 domain-containing protein n=1 Tax=Mucilaginibacter lutimaris TaxID=931629 RepID=A0ABW2ZIY9_9SPHI
MNKISQNQNKPRSSAEKKMVVITIISIVVIIVGALYWLTASSDEDNKNRLQTINNSGVYAKGIITSIHSYKGHSVTVKYQAKGKEYLYDGGWDSNANHLGIGDSIRIKYAEANPSLIITELEDEF